MSPVLPPLDAVGVMALRGGHALVAEPL